MANEINGYVYVAVPMDRASMDTEVKAIDILLALDARSIPQFRPQTAWSNTNNKLISGKIYDTNHAALSNSACVLAYVDGMSIGVPAEMQLAKELGIPVVVITTDDILPVSMSLHQLATGGMYVDIESAANKVHELLYAGRIPARPKHVTGYVEIGKNAAVHGRVPEQKLPGDAGLDLYVSSDVTIQPGQWAAVPSDIKVEPPADIWFMIIGRSSSFVKHGIQVQISIIDSGFRGDLYAMAMNVTDKPITITAGSRIAQLIPMNLIKMNMKQVATVGSSARGSGGFGSTGA